VGIEENNKAISDSMAVAVTLSSVTWEVLPNAGVVRMAAIGSDGRAYKIVLPAW
jgi:hypothetical protein